ncbi:hypothetical protein E2C01_041469 [Portunus trituberculatus]|uniref:Uncharacterized protein n=1 Tax=Portunus trituberculatus TaxID=210409 RepID=A0A5B7FQQ5_PORTR|nr:hypothetical protein [Portunus trituberculatus]
MLFSCCVLDLNYVMVLSTPASPAPPQFRTAPPRPAAPRRLPHHPALMLREGAPASRRGQR